MTRAADIDRFYELLTSLEEQVGGTRRLDDCTGDMDWPERGVCFFFAPDKSWGDPPRLTRVGTHAVSENAQTSLWDKLRAHRGVISGSDEAGGNHRDSAFRKHVGGALIDRDDLHNEYPEWGVRSTAGREQRLEELALERRVSDYIRDLPFLWVKADDEPGPESDRAYLKRNAIALVSNYKREPIDSRQGWLGLYSRSDEIRESELWNVDHVDVDYDPDFLAVLEEKIGQTSPI